MEKETSKTQIDRLGERLKKDSSAESDLRLLEQYRHSFDNAYEIVRKAILEQLSLEATGRRKTTQSIVDKLRRESIRLTQIQDIAGCRLIAADIANQNQLVTSLNNFFENVIVVDRREKPSHGYRAVHVIEQTQEKLIEIQIRTELQHLWAELSEKHADFYGQQVKYGNGESSTLNLLTLLSNRIRDIELVEKELISLPKKVIANKKITPIIAETEAHKNDIIEIMHRVISDIRVKILLQNWGITNDFSD